MSSRKENPKLKVRCQHCGLICKTRMLEFPLDCPNCGKCAKDSEQKVIAVKEIYRNKEREVYIVT